jgi:hypothetical protein
VVQALADLSPEKTAVTGDDAALRSTIDGLLAGGLATESAERACDGTRINDRIARLARIPGADLRSRLIVAGFRREAWIAEGEDGLEQSCATCMYFEVHRQFCVLPELRLPVEARWSCVLWRI